MKNCKYMIIIFLLTVLPLNVAQAQHFIVYLYHRLYLALADTAFLSLYSILPG